MRDNFGVPGWTLQAENGGPHWKGARISFMSELDMAEAVRRRAPDPDGRPSKPRVLTCCLSGSITFFSHTRSSR